MLAPYDGRHLELGKIGRIDVLRSEWAHATGTRPLRRFLFLLPTRGVRGFDSTELPPADKAAALSPHPRSGARVVVDRPEAGVVPSSTVLLEAG